jgi:hypothetical protein
MFFVSKICWSTLGKKSWVHFLLYLCWVDLMTDEEQKKHLTRLKQKKTKKKSFKLFKKIDAFKIAGIFSVQKKI